MRFPLNFVIFILLVATAPSAHAFDCGRLMSHLIQHVKNFLYPPVKSQAIPPANPLSQSQVKPFTPPLTQSLEAKPSLPKKKKKKRGAGIEAQSVIQEKVTKPQSVPQKAADKLEPFNQERFLTDLIYLDQLAFQGFSRADFDVPDKKFIERLSLDLEDGPLLDAARASLNMIYIEGWLKNLAHTALDLERAAILPILEKVAGPGAAYFAAQAKENARLRDRKQTGSVIISMKAQKDLDALSFDHGLENIKRAVDKALGRLSSDPFYPGLRTHPFNGVSGPMREPLFSSYAQNHTPAAYRILWYYARGSGTVTVFRIVPHISSGTTRMD